MMEEIEYIRPAIHEDRFGDIVRQANDHMDEKIKEMINEAINDTPEHINPEHNSEQTTRSTGTTEPKTEKLNMKNFPQLVSALTCSGRSTRNSTWEA